MKDLVEGGYVYIAVPPLYRVKLGNREQYIEKESHFEELLVRERVKDMEVTDRRGEQVKLSETRYNRFTRALNEFEGWSSRLRADFGHVAADLVIAHRLVETETATPAEVGAALAGLEPNGYELSVTEHDDEGFRVRIVERETGAATHATVPAALLASPVYANVRRAHAKLTEVVGSPPFAIALGKKRATAETFEELRAHSLELARDGMQISRFKGLGEMNPSELWQTTMDPANRMLVRVEVEDAAAADLIFSMLMGDQVEPRRLFIEQNARHVRFLDV
jgi:DNA gyrase subunit B